MRGMKIAVIGGGSSYTPELVDGLIRRGGELAAAELWLADVPAGEAKLNTVGGLARRMVGRAGLPLAVQFATKGHEVVGVDVNERVVELVNAGTEPFPGEAQLQKKLAAEVAAGRLRATTNYADAVPGSDAVVVVVPLFVVFLLLGWINRSAPHPTAR